MEEKIIKSEEKSENEEKKENELTKKKPLNVEIHGMYNSGSELLSELLRANFPDAKINSLQQQICSNGGCRWAHMHPEDIAREKTDGLYIFVVRDPIMQMSEWKQPNAAGCFNDKMSFSNVDQCSFSQLMQRGQDAPGKCTACLELLGQRSFDRGRPGIWNEYVSGYAQLAADWDTNKGAKNVMVVQYEKLLANPKEELARIGVRLGAELPKSVDLLEGTFSISVSNVSNEFQTFNLVCPMLHHLIFVFL